MMSEPMTRCVSTTFSGREEVLGAVDMGLEGGAFLAQFSLCRQRKDLITTRIRENRAIPMHELVEAACGLHHGISGPQVKMVGVAENDLRL
jgi:hypothetical protein